MYYYYKEINKKNLLQNNFDDIYISLICFIMLITSGGHIKDVLFKLGIVYNTYKTYYIKGAALILSLYQSYFCSNKYWTRERLKESVIEDFKIIYG